MTFKRICPICGRDFETTSTSRKYCCKVCAKKGEQITQTLYRQKRKDEFKSYNKVRIDEIINDSRERFVNSSQLVACSILAKAHGMSYGHFMAMKEGRL